MTASAVRRVLLVGFMGSGKSSVGADLADRLDWDFLDVDALVEAERGMSVAEIFERLGEGTFREDEARLTERCLFRDGAVIATGGGWAATEGRLRNVPAGTLSVWLRVGPDEAVRRAGSHEGTRPLLSVSDPVTAAADLLEARAPFYARADAEVDTEGLSVEDVSARILGILGETQPES